MILTATKTGNELTPNKIIEEEDPSNLQSSLKMSKSIKVFKNSNSTIEYNDPYITHIPI